MMANRPMSRSRVFLAFLGLLGGLSLCPSRSVAQDDSPFPGSVVAVSASGDHPDAVAPEKRALPQIGWAPGGDSGFACETPEGADESRINFSWENGLVGESANKDFRVHLGGRFDFDSGWYRTPVNLQNSLNTPLLDGTDFRRFRFAADGTVYQQVDFALEADFSRAADFKPGEPQTTIFITNAWVAVHDLPVVDTVRIGHQKEYLTFANATSSNFIPFMERPYIYDAYENDFAFDSGISTNRTYFDKRFTTWIGVFWNGTHAEAFNVGGGGAVSGRATWMPIYDEPGQRWLNFSVSGSARSISTNPEDVTVRPLVRTGQASQVPNLIDTGTINGQDGLQLLGAGVHSASGPWTFGGEFLSRFTPHAFIGGVPNPNGTLPPGVEAVGDLFFWGAYVEVLYFLTPGDHQPVNQEIPGYARVVPVRSFFCNKCQRGPGAWEIGLRYDYVNVNSGLIQAGQLNSVTAGLNWYLNGHARIMLNYVWTNRDTGVSASSGNFSAFGVRAHFDF
jgi:phosphate-selective porin OprO/OprP